jgi:hypothetical protein
MNPNSNALSISSTEIMSVIKGFVIAEAGAVLFTAAAWVTTGGFDWHVFLSLEGAAIGSTAVNFFRKYLPNTNP